MPYGVLTAIVAGTFAVGTMALIYLLGMSDAARYHRRARAQDRALDELVRVSREAGLYDGDPADNPAVCSYCRDSNHGEKHGD